MRKLFDTFSEMSRDYYALLGIDANTTATKIKQAYHKKVRFYHPDKNKGNVYNFQFLYKTINTKHQSPTRFTNAKRMKTNGASTI